MAAKQYNSYTEELDEIEERMREIQIERANIRQEMRNLKLRRGEILPIARLENEYQHRRQNDQQQRKESARIGDRKNSNEKRRTGDAKRRSGDALRMNAVAKRMNEEKTKTSVVVKALQNVNVTIDAKDVLKC